MTDRIVVPYLKKGVLTMNRQNIIKIIMCIFIIGIIILVAQQYRSHGKSEQNNVKIQSSTSGSASCTSCTSCNCCISCANALQQNGFECTTCSGDNLSCGCGD